MKLGVALPLFLPPLAFVAAAAVADIWVEYKTVSVGGLLAAAPFYVAVVGLPSLLPFHVAHLRTNRAAVLIVMTAIAGTAGALVVTTDDAQADLAALWVPYVGIPLAVAVRIGQIVITRTRHGVG